MIKTNLGDFPESWDELKFSKSLELLESTTKAEAIRIILNAPKGAKIEGIESLYRAAKFLDVPLEIDPKPEKIGDYKLTQDITLESTEQFEDLSSELKRVMNLSLRERTEALAFYVSVYIQPQWFASSYDSEQARHLSKIILDYPCTEVMSAGAFFQAKYLSLESGLSMSYLMRNIPQKRGKRVSTSWLKLLGRMQLWIILRVMWASMTRFFSKRGQ